MSLKNAHTSTFVPTPQVADSTLVRLPDPSIEVVHTTPNALDLEDLAVKKSSIKTDSASKQSSNKTIQVEQGQTALDKQSQAGDSMAGKKQVAKNTSKQADTSAKESAKSQKASAGTQEKREANKQESREVRKQGGRMANEKSSSQQDSTTATAHLAEQTTKPKVHHLQTDRVGVNSSVEGYALYPCKEAWQQVVYGEEFFKIPEQSVYPYREVDAQEIFGRQTILVTPRDQQAAPKQMLTSDAPFQIFVLVLACLYSMLLYYNLSDIKSLLSRISRNSGNRHQDVFEESSGSSFSRFLNITTTLGVLFVGIIVVKYGDQLISGTILAQLPYGAALTLSLLVTAICALIIGLQWVFLHLVGLITISKQFIAQIQQIRQIYFSLSAIIIAPTLLLFALCNPQEGKIWFFLILIELAITLLLYIREILNLFISKKISILHWFLYLCTVEIFPISLLWLLATK